MDGTPIYDIKPYLAYVDSHPEAAGGFTDQIQDHKLKVEFPEKLLKKIPEEKREALLAVLANDPRPGYQKDPELNRKNPCKKTNFFIKWRKSF